MDFSVALTVKKLSAMQETQVQSLGREDAPEKEMAAHSSTLVWRIAGAEEPGGLQSVEVPRVRHEWMSNTTTAISQSHGKDEKLEMICVLT